jgi:hypothetical protein
LLALAAPTPRLEPVPALPLEEPPVPSAVFALPLVVVEAPLLIVEELCAKAGAAAITATSAAAERRLLLCNILFHSMDAFLPLTENLTWVHHGRSGPDRRIPHAGSLARRSSVSRLVQIVRIAWRQSRNCAG